MKKRYVHMPVIIFDNFMLRTIHKHDYVDMFEYGKDSEVTKYLTWGPMVHPIEAKKSIINVFYPRIRQGLPRGYAIVDLQKNKMIGTIDFHSKPKGVNGAEIGFCLHKDYWRQGIMSKALQELIKIGFDELAYDIIYIKHLKSNIGSQKVIEKTLFTKVNEEPFILKKLTSTMNDSIIMYELTREKYYANQQS